MKIVNLSVMTLVLFATVSLFIIHKTHREEISVKAERELATAIKYGFSDLTSGNFRNFVEASPFLPSYIEIETSDSKDTFALGTYDSSNICSNQTLGLENVDYRILWCARQEIPFVATATILLLLLISVSLTLAINKNLNDKLRRDLNTIFNSLGVESTNGNSLVEIVQHISQIRSEIRKSQMREQQKALNEGIGRITRKVAHDLRSPLMGLRVALEREINIPLASLAINRIESIANDILKGQNLDVDNINLGELIEEVLAIVTAGKLDTRIVSELSESVVVLGVRAELIRIISNLLNNSIEAKATEIKLIFQSETNSLLIIDNGEGIEDGQIGSLFQEGFTTKQGLAGNGLGLFHAREAITSWGGEIQIESVRNEKTVVKIDFPKERTF